MPQSGICGASRIEARLARRDVRSSYIKRCERQMQHVQIAQAKITANKSRRMVLSIHSTYKLAHIHLHSCNRICCFAQIVCAHPACTLQPTSNNTEEAEPKQPLSKFLQEARAALACDAAVSCRLGMPQAHQQKQTLKIKSRAGRCKCSR